MAVANGLWMGRIGSDVTDEDGGVLTGERYLIHDSDPLFDQVRLASARMRLVRNRGVSQRMDGTLKHYYRAAVWARVDR